MAGFNLPDHVNARDFDDKPDGPDWPGECRICKGETHNGHKDEGWTWDPCDECAEECEECGDTPVQKIPSVRSEGRHICAYCERHLAEE